MENTQARGTKSCATSKFLNATATDINDLLECLCKNFTAANHTEILRNVTQYISNCPNAVGCSSLPYDEGCLVAEITKYLNMPQASGAGCSLTLFEASGGKKSQNNSALFLKFYEELKSCLESRQLVAHLTFLYFMVDTKYIYDNSSIEKTTTPIEETTRSKPYNPTQAIRGGHMVQTASPDINHKISIIRQTIQHSVCLSGGSENENIGTTTNLPGASSTQLPIRGTAISGGSENENIGTTTNLPGASSTQLPIRGTAMKQLPENSLSDDIVQNVIYAFIGVQGKYLKKDVVSGRFNLNNATNVSIPQGGMLKRLSELGYYHNLLQLYTDIKSGLCAVGFMGQGFIASLTTELTIYYGMVASLQDEFNRQQQTERLTFAQILVWSVKPLHRLQLLARIAAACQEKKGGDLASIVHGFLGTGNKGDKNIAKDLLLAICGPLYQMLSGWLFEGEISDPHGEFFIECLQEVSSDRLWHDKYCVRLKMLPNFISIDLANKILVTGKSINFLYETCEDKTLIRGKNDLKKCIEKNADHIFSTVADTKLHSTIESIYITTSKRLLDIVMGPYKLMEHLQAMRRYLLLGQGDFIEILIENLKSELDKPAKELYSYDISFVMESALRSTNHYDPELLNHLDVLLMTPCDGDIGWDILSLQYTLKGPLATLLNPSMSVYQLLFKPLWHMKHMEFLVSSKIWKDQKFNSKHLQPMALELKKILYRLHLFTSEMIHFINQMQYYLLFEVIECSWVELQKQVYQAPTLDAILNAHDIFLNTIKCGAFLDSNSNELYHNMETVYQGIVRLEVWQDKFFELCFRELNARKQYQQDILTSEEKGKIGITAEQKLERDQEIKIFEQTLSSYQISLENIGKDYEEAVSCFLLALNSNNNHNLQLFGIRLDFNEYYKKRDQRLCVPLTFEHMRMSSVVNLSNTKRLLGSRQMN